MQQLLFPEAVTYPTFFNENLADPNRVLKIISGQDSWARSFYYQLFKLIFEIQTNDEKAKQYIEFLLSITKRAMKPSKDSKQTQKMNQFFQTIQKFSREFANERGVQFENYITQNPQVDQALVAVLNKIIKDANIQNQSVSQKLKYLGQLFELTMLQFDKGIKFEESDTFIYIENEQAVYIAFLNISQFNEQQQGAGESEQSEDNMDNVIKSVSLQKSCSSREPAEGVIKQSPVDYLLTNKFRSGPQNAHSPPAQPKEQSLHNYSQDEQAVIALKEPGKQDTNLQFTLGSKKEETQKQNPHIVNSTYLKHAETIEEPIGFEFENKNKESIVQQRIGISKQVQISAPSPKNKSILNNQADIFYKPAPKVDIMNLIGKNSPSSTESKVNKRDPLDFGNDSQKGTFYRKFTETKILNLLTQPYRSKVKMLKNRFIGVRGNNHAFNNIKSSKF